MMAVAMTEQVHQGAGQQEQIWQCQRDVAGMVPEKVGAERSDGERNGPTRSGAEEASELIGCHREVSAQNCE